MGSHAALSRKVKDGLEMIKAVATRDEGLAILEQCPMSLKMLKETEAGVRIRRILRHCERARELHDRWLSQAENEMINNWEEVKYMFLSSADVRILDQAQAAYSGVANPSHVLSPVPLTPGRYRNDSTTDINSSFTRDFDHLSHMNDRWLDGTPMTPGIPKTPRVRRNETDESVDDMLISSDDSFRDTMLTEKRGRGRPRKNPVKPVSSRGRRGRPPVNR